MLTLKHSWASDSRITRSYAAEYGGVPPIPPYAGFHRFVMRGLYPPNWGNQGIGLSHVAGE
jgi:hypothetical protein